MMDNLETALLDAFDKTYREQQPAAHREAIVLYRLYQKSGENACLKQHSAAKWRGLRDHLKRVSAMIDAG